MLYGILYVRCARPLVAISAEGGCPARQLRRVYGHQYPRATPGRGVFVAPHPASEAGGEMDIRGYGKSQPVKRGDRRGDRQPAPTRVLVRVMVVFGETKAFRKMVWKDFHDGGTYPDSLPSDCNS